MRWASKLNLGTVQVVKTSQHLKVEMPQTGYLPFGAIDR